MKRLILGLVAALFTTAALAQTLPLGSVATGRGPGVSGLNGVAPGTAGVPLVSAGALTQPVFGPMTSDSCTFLQSGVGAVSRTCQDKMREAVSVTDFGAVGDGVLYNTNASITSGTATLIVSAGTFTSSDIGKKIVIPGAGAAGGTLAATISAVGSTVSITLNTNASTTLSAASTDITYGTDDTVAIQRWATELVTNGGYGQFPKYQNYLITSEIVFEPQNNDGGASLPDVGTNPSDIWFVLNKRTIGVDFNGSRLIAAASMTQMVRLSNNASLAGTYGEFFCVVENGVLNGAGLATRGIYLNGEGQCEIKRNRIYGTTTSAIKHSIYGVNVFAYNVLRAPTVFDLTDGGSDSLFIHNDLYPTLRGFYLTAASGGQMRIISNAGTNELGSTSPGTTVNFIEIDTTTNSNILRNISILDNGVAGFSNFIYARGNSTSFNNKYFIVRGNNVLDYGTKADLAFINSTETQGWTISGNTFNPVNLTVTSIAFLMTNDNNSSIVNNFITRTENTGIQVAFGTRGSVLGNRLHNIGNGVNTKVIRITNASSRMNISNNTIDQDSGAFGQDGIVEEDTSNNNVGLGNITLNVTTPVTLVGAASHISAGFSGTGNVPLSPIGLPQSATSGGIPYFNSSTTMSGSGVLAAAAIVLGGGAGAAPTTSGCTIDGSNSLNCASATSFRPAFFITNSTNDGGNPGFSFQKSRSGGTITTGDNLGSFGFYGFANGSMQVSAGITVASTGTITGSNIPSRITFNTSNAAGQNVQGLRFDNNAHLGISAQQTAPTLTAGCNGAGSSISGAKDLHGTVTGQTAAATTCTVTFGTAFASTPDCVVSGQTGAITSYTPSTTTLVVNFGSTANFKWNWVCFGG